MGGGYKFGQKVPKFARKKKKPGIQKNRRIRKKCVGYGAYTKKMVTWCFGLNLSFSFCQKKRGKKSQEKFTYLLTSGSKCEKNPFFYVPPWKKKPGPFGPNIGFNNYY